MRTKIVFVTLILLAGVVAGVVIIASRGGKHAVEVESVPKPEPAVKSVTVTVTPVAPLASTQAEVIIPPPAQTQPAPSAQSKVATTQVHEAQAEPSLVINGYTVQDPIARAALSFVGADPDADAYWMDAINNPDLPAEERKDLIEDLNEDGLANPRLAAPEDLPIIANRIALIEEIAPQAMDQTDADALAEAHKDLVKLYNGLPAD